MVTLAGDTMEQRGLEGDDCEEEEEEEEQEEVVTDACRFRCLGEAEGGS
jgi:hypothetical protein